MTEDVLKSDSTESRNLARDAAALRREILQNRGSSSAPDRFPRGRKIFYALALILVLGCTFLVLGSQSVRRSLVRAVAVRVAGNPDTSARVFSLPAPPPKAPRVSTESATFAASGSDEVLFADSPPVGAASESGQQDAETEPKFVPPPKTQEAAQAYALLQSNSEVAAAVIGGGREDFKFREWMPRKVDPPVFWIDLVTERTSDGQEVHLIWQVNLDSGEIQPLSQEARDLTR